MKKLIVALAAVAMTGGFAAKADVCRQECENNNKCVNAECPAAKCVQPERKGACPFDNLNLTDAQKEQFKALRAKKAEACKAQKAAKKQAKSECRRAELAEIKAILTPEQYVQFLENSYVQRGKARMAGKNVGARCDMKHAACERGRAAVRAEKVKKSQACVEAAPAKADKK